MFLTRKRYEKDLEKAASEYKSDFQRLEERYWQLREHLELIERHLGIEIKTIYKHEQLIIKDKETQNGNKK